MPGLKPFGIEDAGEGARIPHLRCDNASTVPRPAKPRWLRAECRGMKQWTLACAYPRADSCRIIPVDDASRQRCCCDTRPATAMAGRAIILVSTRMTLKRERRK